MAGVRARSVLSVSTSTVTFPADVLRQFAAASGDRSPLHSDDGYARQTSFGQTIIHGSCSLLAMAARVPLGTAVPVSLTTIFRQAVLPDASYEIAAAERRNGWRVELRDGDVPLITANLQAGAGDAEAAHEPASPPAPMRERSANPAPAEGVGQPAGHVSYA